MMTKIRTRPWICLLAYAACWSTITRAESPSQQVVAFPGAEGAGRFATGGRGGEVVHVTNLHAKGPGSLAEAVSQPNRIVVFDVSGIIDLTIERDGELRPGKIAIEQPNITIAGQTAPGEGICLKGGCLDISAGNVIVRYLRSRRGWIAYGDSGDAIEVKPPTAGEKTEAAGQSTEVFERIQAKKAERGKFIHEFAEISNIIVDHCSTSWATDENLSVTRADGTTVSWSIAAEGCDYENPTQTPPNHAEGSLWGSPAPDGRATMHHMLFAHNRLRNPRTTAGDDIPPVLNFYNSVVYNWSEHASHTGSERVLVNWLNNYYKPGRDTPHVVSSIIFEFHGDPGAQIYAQGNVVHGSPEATADNRLAVGYDRKFYRLADAQRAAMLSDAPFADAPSAPSTAEAAYAAVLADVGATLPARDTVDLRIVESVAQGDGGIIEKETDLPPSERWPEYRSLPPPSDADRDGLPDFWEKQFGLDAADNSDSARISHGYAHVEHYFNNTSPRGDQLPIVYVAAAVSRARPNRPGQWRIARRGDFTEPLTVQYLIRGDAAEGRDYAPLTGEVTIPAGDTSAPVPLSIPPEARSGGMVVISLITQQKGCHVGCPAESLLVIENGRR